MGNNINEKIVILCKDTAKITVPECCVEISLECNCTMGKRREIKKIYRTNCDVVQIFPTMSKAVATRQKNPITFSHVFDKAHHDQLLTRHLPFAPLCRVDEWMTKSSLSSLQDLLSKFCQIMAAKTLKICSQAVTFKIF